MKKQFSIISILIIFVISIIIIKMKTNLIKQEDLLIFKIFSKNTLKSEEEDHQIYLKISDKKTECKQIEILKTINNQDLIKKKIAPGMSRAISN